MLFLFVLPFLCSLVHLAACLCSSAALYAWIASSFCLVHLALSVECFSWSCCRFCFRLLALLFAFVRLLFCMSGLPVPFVLFILPFLLHCLHVICLRFDLHCLTAVAVLMRLLSPSSSTPCFSSWLLMEVGEYWACIAIRLRYMSSFSSAYLFALCFDLSMLFLFLFTCYMFVFFSTFQFQHGNGEARLARFRTKLKSGGRRIGRLSTVLLIDLCCWYCCSSALCVFVCVPVCIAL